MRLSPFGRARRPETGAAARIKDEARQILGLTSAAVIAVNEILCTDPGCAGTETVILVMNPGEKTRAYKVLRPLAEVDRPALLAALRPES